MRNFFPTLNDALESESLVTAWPLGLNIGYGETRSTVTDSGHFISVYRDERGYYERPIHYDTIYLGTMRREGKAWRLAIDVGAYPDVPDILVRA